MAGQSLPWESEAKKSQGREESEAGKESTAVSMEELAGSRSDIISADGMEGTERLSDGRGQGEDDKG